MKPGHGVRFTDRQDAGRRLAELVAELGLAAPVVLGLPRGGVPVAFEVARALDAPLDVLVAKKVGAPGQPEFGIGAVAEGGVVVSDAAAVRAAGLSDGEFAELAGSVEAEVIRRVDGYRGVRELPTLEDRDVVVVDDGLATGVTAGAALRSVRRFAARSVTLAVPVSAASTAERFGPLLDHFVCVAAPDRFGAVGSFYDDFAQTTDQQVRELLDGPR